MNFVIVSEKSWNSQLLDRLDKQFPNDSWTLINKREDLTVDNMFGAFFTMPYPRFRLQVKGFYGKPVIIISIYIKRVESSQHCINTLNRVFNKS